MNFTPHDLQPVSRLFGYRNLIISEKSIYWNYETFGDKIPTDLNAGCYDVSKKRVAEVHKKALGYNLAVNPLTFKRKYLKKTNLQGVKEIEVLTGKNQPEEGYVYERLLDNSTEYRYFYHKKYPFVLKKTKKQNDFSNDFIKCELVEFTAEQHNQVNKFGVEFGIDWAELDILISANKIYIIDVNNIAGNGNLFQRCENGAQIEKLYIRQIQSL